MTSRRNEDAAAVVAVRDGTVGRTPDPFDFGRRNRQVAALARVADEPRRTGATVLRAAALVVGHDRFGNTDRLVAPRRLLVHNLGVDLALRFGDHITETFHL